MPTPQRRVAVVGSGPVGMVAALELSKRRPTTLITCRLPAPDETPRVEAVPASLLALLVEYGIHPRRLGVEQLHETRLVAWGSADYVEGRGFAAAHVERPALDLALLGALKASRRVEIITLPPSAVPEAVAGLRGEGVRLIDATGRRALTAGKRMHATRPWAARMFVAPGRARAGGELRIAALPCGYAYRIGAASSLTLGIVGRGKSLAGAPSELERYLHGNGAGWILVGLPAIGDMTPGVIAPASVQWAVGGDGLRIGDAALARDALSSQGLAAGISEALYAAAVSDEADEEFLALRQSEQRAAHLGSLASLIDGCRFRAAEAWKEYAEFIKAHLSTERLASGVVLRDGSLRIHDFPGSDVLRQSPPAQR